MITRHNTSVGNNTPDYLLLCGDRVRDSDKLGKERSGGRLPDPYSCLTAHCQVPCHVAKRNFKMNKRVWVAYGRVVYRALLYKSLGVSDTSLHAVLFFCSAWL